MTKQLGIIVAVLVLLVAGGGAVFMMTKSSPATSGSMPPVQTEQTAQVSQPSQSQGSLKSLLSMSQPQSCTYSSQSASGSVSGKAYVASGKMRGDFTSTPSQGAATTGHMIVDSGYSYFWMDGSTTGYKFTLSTASPAATSGTNGASGASNLENPVSYSCGNWSVDSSVFNLPTGVTFSTFTVPSAPAGMASPTNESASQCAACDNLPAGAGRDACRTQLHCQ